MMYLFKVKGQSTEEIVFITCIGKGRGGSGDSLLVKKCFWLIPEVNPLGKWE